MKKEILFAFLMLVLAGCTTTGNSVIDTSNAGNLKDTTLEIEGMYCASCAIGVEYELKHVDGVVDAKVSLEEGKGYVKYDPSKVDAETIAKASTVYPAKVIR